MICDNPDWWLADHVYDRRAIHSWLDGWPLCDTGPRWTSRQGLLDDCPESANPCDAQPLRCEATA